MGECASCGHHTSEVMSFGDVALAGAFLKQEDFERERKYPLSLDFCESCHLLQVPHQVPRETLFSDYFYFSSAIGTLEKHFAHYAAEIVDRFAPDVVLEIGCNDGVLLKPLADLGVRKIIGIDPATNIVNQIDDPRIRIVNDYFGPGVFKGRADVIVANNVYAHVSNLNGTTAAIADALTDDGVFIFEVNRLDSLIADKQYDWVYHEHRFYYSLMALEPLLARHGLQVFDLKRIGTHAGSIRYYACREGKRDETMIVEEQRHKERWHRLHEIDRFHKFASDSQEHIATMQFIVKAARSVERKVVGYGACGRANTMLQACGFGPRDFDFIVDDAPAKQGFYTPGSHIPIKPRSALEGRSDLLIVFAWSFLREIEPKLAEFKGDVLIPLPEIYKLQERKAA